MKMKLLKLIQLMSRLQLQQKQIILILFIDYCLLIIIFVYLVLLNIHVILLNLLHVKLYLVQAKTLFYGLRNYIKFQ